MPLTTLEEANQLVLGKIGNQGESLILGFLPLSLAEEEAVLRLAREALTRPFASVISLLRTAPAAMAYALAVAPGRTLTEGGRFWPALKDDLGLDVSSPSRVELAEKFRRTCRSLQLMDGTIEEIAWVHAAPFIFQAGILHFWKDALATALRCTLKQVPPPDCEDSVALRRFTDELINHVHNQPTLEKLLGTDVGCLLANRLVQAYSRQDWQVLPPHLQEPIRLAFQEIGRGAVLKSPYLTFNPAYHQLEIVLPTVPGKFASADTYWALNGRRYSARQQWEIPTSECLDAEVKIELRQLFGSYRPQAYAVTTTLGGTIPFRLFRKDTGRERRVSLDAVIDLSPGAYLVVMASDIRTNDEGYVVATGAYRELEFELRPGDDPVILKRGEETWTLRPERHAGIYVNRDRANVVTLTDGENLHYGDDLGLVAFFPAEENVAGPTALILSCKEHNLTRVHQYTESIAVQGGYRFETELNHALKDILALLPPGIHRLHLSLVRATARIDHTIWYWRGLRLITSVGFDCEALPTNLKIRDCKGFIEKEGALCFPEKFHGTSMVVAIRAPEVELKIPRAGVQVEIKDAGTEWEDIVSPTIPTIVQPNDKRLLRFSSGGYQEWSVLSHTRAISVLNAKRPSYVTTLAGLSAELGGAGRVFAKGENGTSIPLISIMRPLTSDLPRFNLDHANNTETWRFRLPLPENCEIGVSITDLSSAPDAAACPVAVIANSTNGALSFQDFILTDAGNGETILVVNAKEKDGTSATEGTFIRVRTTMQIAALKDRLWMLDFHRRTNAADPWIPLECAERIGYSSVRLFAWGEMPPGADALWWHRLRRAEKYQNDSKFIDAIASMSSGDLRRALRFCREFLSWKYATTVWVRQAKRLQIMPRHLARLRFRMDDESAAVWWDEAADELARFSASPTNPVVRQFLFATRLDSLRIPSSSMTRLSVMANIAPLARALAVPSAIHSVRTLREYLLPATDRGELAREILYCYKNFQRVATGRDPDFEDLDLNTYLAGGTGVIGLSSASVALDETLPRFEVTTLLGAEHLLSAVRALNRRCRPLHDVSNGDPDQGLATMVQALEAMSQRVDRVAPVIARRLGWNSGSADGQSYWTPPLLENVQANKAASLIWCIAALSRLTANGYFTSQEYTARMELLLAPVDNAEANAARLLSLGPELFAFYVALFELTAPSQP